MSDLANLLPTSLDDITETLSFALGYEGRSPIHHSDNGHDAVYITVGQTVNLAARLQSVAPPGSISIGEQTKRLVEGYFDLTVLPPVSLKGIIGPVPIYEVLGPGRLRRHSQISARREFSKFVGRTRELSQLHRALEFAMAGKGQLVSLVTDAGSGKSRLVLEFSRTAPFDCKIMEGYAVSHGRQTPWLPVIGMLREYFGILEFDDPEKRRGKVTEVLAGLGAELDDVQPFIFVLLGIVDGPNDPLRHMDPRVRRERTVDAINRIFVAESAKQPVVLIFEDLHWIDEQTKFLLRRLAAGIAGERILVLTTWRPDYVPDWLARKHITEIRLEPLSTDSSEALLSSLLGDDPELARLKQIVVERAGGNPFFIEEMVNALFEDGTLRRDGSPKLARPLSELHVPMTVRGMLAERIDQAVPQSKEMLQLLSVIGHRLPMDVVLKVSRWPGMETERILSDLQTADFIYAQSAVQAGKNEVDYAFKHVMTQEVAYHSVLVEQRKSLHHRVGEAIESLYEGNLNDHVTSLMHHYSSTDDHRKAMEYLGKAGQQAIQRSAHHDAINHIREALRRIPMLPDGTVGPADSASLWSALGISLQVTNGYASDEVGLAYAQAQEMSMKAQDDLGLAVALRGIFLFNHVRADYGKAVQAGRDLVVLGGRDSSSALEGYVSLGLTHEYIGDFKASDEYFSKALNLEADSALAEQVQYLGHARAICRSYYALALANLGQLDRAMALSQEALSLSETMSLPITTAQSLGVHGVVVHKMRAYQTAELYYDETIACASRHGFPYWRTLAAMLKSSLMTGRSDPGPLLAEFERGLASHHRTGTRLGTTWYFSLRAELLAATGRIDDALDATEEALAFIEETGERMNEATVHRLKGALILNNFRHGRGGGFAAAEASFTRNLRIASRQQAKLWELRAAISLACVRAHQRRFDEGLKLLRAVYTSFTEGFSMPDLIDALRLIEYLSRSGAGTFPVSDVGGSALLEM
jgi:predicted ATPase